MQPEPQAVGNVGRFGCRERGPAAQRRGEESTFEHRRSRLDRICRIIGAEIPGDCDARREPLYAIRGLDGGELGEGLLHGVLHDLCEGLRAAEMETLTEGHLELA